MNVVIPATEFEVCVSMADLVTWSDDDALPVDQHPELKALFDALAADIDLLPIAIQYFENNNRAGHGDLYVFKLDDTDSTVVALDTYSEITDQLDLVSLYIRCPKAKSAEISQCVQRLCRYMLRRNQSASGSAKRLIHSTFLGCILTAPLCNRRSGSPFSREVDRRHTQH